LGKQLKWLQSLKVPPAVDNVEIFARGSEPQARWIDDAGRQQRLYSKKHRISQSEAKFQKVGSLDKKIEKLRAIVLDGLSDDGKDGECAAVLYLILTTGIRVGENKDTGGAVKAYGACTLEGRHVKVSGNRVNFDFTGKKGVRQQHQYTDARLAKIIRDRKGKSKDRLFDISAGGVRNYLQWKMGRDSLTPKDLRTYLATKYVAKALKKVKKAATKKEFNAVKRELGDEVAEKLGNTRAVSLSGYVNPDLWKKVHPDGEEWRPAALKE